MRRVDLLIRSSKPFSFEKYMAKALTEAFEGFGVATQSVAFDQKGVLEYASSVNEDPPLFTLSFSHQLSLKNKEIPHFYWEWRTVAESLHLLNFHSKLGISCRKMAQKCSSLGLDVSFLPPAAKFPEKESHERPYDVVLFDDLICTNYLEQNWQEFFEPSYVQKLHAIVEKCQENPSHLPLDVILSQGIDEEKLNDTLFLAEEYLKAKRISALLETFEGVQVHVFGEHIGNNWLKRLKNSKNIHLHSSHTQAGLYTDYFDILKSSKWIVRDQIHHKDGVDEWVFAAIAHGCLPITSKTPYLEQELGRDLWVFYSDGNWDEMNERLRPFSADILVELKERVKKNHTFESRAQTLLEWMR